MIEFIITNIIWWFYFFGLLGLGCTDNRTLNLYTLDYQTQRGLAESLGLNGPKIHTLIVNPTLESYYLMEEEFSAENLSRYFFKLESKVLL